VGGDQEGMVMVHLARELSFGKGSSKDREEKPGREACHPVLAAFTGGKGKEKEEGEKMRSMSLAKFRPRVFPSQLPPFAILEKERGGEGGKGRARRARGRRPADFGALSRRLACRRERGGKKRGGVRRVSSELGNSSIGVPAFSHRFQGRKENPSRKKGKKGRGKEGRWVEV